MGCFFEANGVVQHFSDDGAATGGGAKRPALVFINSLGTDYRIWDDVIAALPGSFRTLRYDKRGHGLSGSPAGDWRIEDFADDFAALMDARGVGGATIVGLSVGGLIALALAARRPDLVRSIVFCDTAHRIGTAESWNARIAAVEAGGLESIADAVMERWFAAAFRSGRPVDLAGWRTMLVRAPADGYVRTCAAIRDADFTSVARTLAVPALCLVGDEDGATPPDLVRSLADLVPGAGFSLIEGAGHIPCVDQPGVVADHIVRHLGEAGLA